MLIKEGLREQIEEVRDDLRDIKSGFDRYWSEVGWKEVASTEEMEDLSTSMTVALFELNELICRVMEWEKR